MKFLRKIIRTILPVDRDNSCGYGPFKLPEDHPFTPACNLHDWEFDQANKGAPDKPLDKADWDLFYRWVLIANNSTGSYEEKCALAMQICKLWPLARTFGGVLWDGDPITESQPQ